LLAPIAFLVAFGVLLDTIVVRSLLVPALAHDLGERVWWTWALGRTQELGRARESVPSEPAPAASGPLGEQDAGAVGLGA